MTLKLGEENGSGGDRRIPTPENFDGLATCLGGVVSSMLAFVSVVTGYSYRWAAVIGVF